LAIIDTRRSGPGSPRGKRRTGRSYRDLTSLSSSSPTRSDKNGEIPMPKEGEYDNFGALGIQVRGDEK